MEPRRSGGSIGGGEKLFYHVRHVHVADYGSVPVLRGDLAGLPEAVQRFVAESVRVLEPRGVWVCDGSAGEAAALQGTLVGRGLLHPLRKHPSTFLCRTEPSDVARVEDKTWIVTPERVDTEADLHRAPALNPEGASPGSITPRPKPGLAQWMSPGDAKRAVATRFPGAMHGRVLYVIPFSMGPIGGRGSMTGVELTDSPYVVLCMRIMTRVSTACLYGRNGEPVPFVRCVHSVGVPLPSSRGTRSRWECNPEKTIILHWPLDRTIWSYGSGYGGNSLLGKKCLALRIASWAGREEGWFAAHMAVFSVTREADGVKRYFGAAFPSGCGKTNMALMKPAKPGWKIECVGDDIAWLRWNPVTGRLCATCPENGFFGVAPGSNERTNPYVLTMLHANSIITNVAETSDGDFYWEGLEKEKGGEQQLLIKDWRGDLRPLNPTAPTEAKWAHPNARFAAPLSECPIRHPDLPLDSYGVPLDAIIFGSRRTDHFPLVYEASHLVQKHEDKAAHGCTPWLRGTYIGASLVSEPTAAAQSKTPVSSGKRALKPEPFGMRPFVAYNFGRLCLDWMRLGEEPRVNAGVTPVLPRVYHVNLFREDEKSGEVLWPGFGENIRILEWMMKRLDEGPGKNGCLGGLGELSQLGIVPKKEEMDLSGLEGLDWEQVMEQMWVELGKDAASVCAFFKEQGGRDFPVRLVVCAFQHLGIHTRPLLPLFQDGWEHMEAEAIKIFDEDLSQESDNPPTLYYVSPKSSLSSDN